MIWFYGKDQKKRHVISHTKQIGEVKGSTRKIYKQKGTGRARHGSVRGAQFVGGGIIFGPNKHKVCAYKMNKKVKEAALLSALASKYKSESIVIYEHLQSETNRSQDFLKMYGNSFLSKKTLLVDSNFDDKIINATNNIKNVDRLNILGLNVLDIVNHERICFSERAFNICIGRFSK
jgi:large subunit ribosomal protein L4